MLLPVRLEVNGNMLKIEPLCHYIDGASLPHAKPKIFVGNTSVATLYIWLHKLYDTVSRIGTGTRNFGINEGKERYQRCSRWIVSNRETLISWFFIFNSCKMLYSISFILLHCIILAHELICLNCILFSFL